MTSQIVNTTEEIIAKLQNLPPQQQQQVADRPQTLMSGAIQTKPA
ncbi:MAG: hypothetical protein WBA07_08850 [Rivularia sp. (in: cyanobacteria)]